jgi:hypothetical protein
LVIVPPLATALALSVLLPPAHIAVGERLADTVGNALTVRFTVFAEVCEAQPNSEFRVIIYVPAVPVTAAGNEDVVFVVDSYIFHPVVGAEVRCQ